MKTRFYLASLLYNAEFALKQMKKRPEYKPQNALLDMMHVPKMVSGKRLGHGVVESIDKLAMRGSAIQLAPDALYISGYRDTILSEFAKAGESLKFRFFINKCKSAGEWGVYIAVQNLGTSMKSIGAIAKLSKTMVCITNQPQKVESFARCGFSFINAMKYEPLTTLFTTSGVIEVPVKAFVQPLTNEFDGARVW